MQKNTHIVKPFEYRLKYIYWYVNMWQKQLKDTRKGKTPNFRQQLPLGERGEKESEKGGVHWRLQPYGSRVGGGWIFLYTFCKSNTS